MRDKEVLNALSRRDNETLICSACGEDEAMYDFVISRAEERTVGSEEEARELEMHIYLARQQEQAWLTEGKPLNELYGKPYVPLMAR
ncbi:MAG: hypothetical protein AB1384_12335 [Actinomycetota bacterium]